MFTIKQQNELLTSWQVAGKIGYSPFRLLASVEGGTR
jgi:hypothetical protein